MEKPTGETSSHGPLKVINAGLMRTATKSMSEAYNLLGLRSHHGHDLSLSPSGLASWSIWERAAEATFASALGISPPPPKFTRADWDTIYANYDASTDVGAHFAEELIAAYPEAKVVVVQRDFEAWWESFEAGVVGPQHTPGVSTFMYGVEWLTGLRGFSAALKVVHGFFGARDLPGIKARAREVYFGYYDRIRKLVPAERRLEYKIGDGWGPLCEFLGKDVPDVPFPHVNDRKEHREMQLRDTKIVLGMCWDVMKPWVLLGTTGLVGVGIAIWRNR